MPFISFLLWQGGAILSTQKLYLTTLPFYDIIISQIRKETRIMNITYGIREQIVEAIVKKIEYKYIDDIKKAKQLRDFRCKLWSGAEKAACEAARAYIDSHIVEQEEYIDTCDEYKIKDYQICHVSVNGEFFPLKGEKDHSSIFWAYCRMMDEANEIAKGIIDEIEREEGEVSIDYILSQI